MAKELHTHSEETAKGLEKCVAVAELLLEKLRGMQTDIQPHTDPVDKTMLRLKRQQVLRPTEVALLYGIPTGTLKQLRYYKKGPEFFQRGKGQPIYYTHDAILSYLKGMPLKERLEQELGGEFAALANWNGPDDDEE